MIKFSLRLLLAASRILAFLFLRLEIHSKVPMVVLFAPFGGGFQQQEYIGSIISLSKQDDQKILENVFSGFLIN